MTSKSKPSKVNNLLAAIQRTGPSSAASASPEPLPVAAAPDVPRKAARRSVPPPATISRVGKPVQFWLHDEDRKLVRELAAWLAGQGIRPTDSMVIRAALRMAKTGGELLEAARQSAQLDGRLKQRKTG